MQRDLPSGLRFLWGNDPDPNLANYDETGIGTTSAVGCFPNGASLYKVEDLSGNVWEWCRTKWEDNDENYQTDNDLEGEDRRVVHGGAFYNARRDVRCTYRYDWDPSYRSGSRGFRVCVVSQQN